MANYVLLERIELNNTAASVTFSSIPQTGYTDLKIVYSARTDRTNTNSDIYLQFNGVTTATYSFKRVYGGGSGAAASDTLTNNATGGFAGTADGASATASTFGNCEVYIPSYNSSTAKSWSADGVNENNATSALAAIYSGSWSGTAAITSITLKDYNAANFVTGSTFSLYGIAAVGTTPTIAPKASGGNVIATDGTYWYHAFLSNGTFTPAVGLSCDYLVVAGGGAGAWRSGNAGGAGGGGAGGLRSTVTSTGGGGSLESALSLASGTAYTVTVGAGGTASGTNDTAGTSGTNSTFASITATGGGYGSPTSAIVAANGGSGGGGSNAGAGQTAGIASPSGQGYKGGDGNNAAGNGAGGGGGAGAAAATVSGQSGTAGGVGVWTALSDAVTAGQLSSGHYYLAGGGGGGAYTGGSGGAGGIGGGSAGALNTSTTNATVNTGGGGGSVGSSTVGTRTAGNGGSGIVIVRYTVA